MKILIVIPARNEERVIKTSLRKLTDFCRNNLNDDWQIVVSDNNSSDRTGGLVKEAIKEEGRIVHYPLTKKGKGLAVISAWQKFSADIYCFMDADLATDLEALPKIINAIKEEGYGLAVGSRFAKGSLVKRSLLRKVFSLGYRLIIKLFLGLSIKDAPCGFKAISQEVKDKVLPQIKDDQFFFDTELLVLAEKEGYKIKEIPVIWQEIKPAGRTSQVKVMSLAKEYFKQILKLKKRLKG